MNPSFARLLARIGFVAIAIALFYSLAWISPAQAAGPNLLPNSTFAQADPADAGTPLQWRHGAWGTHQSVFAYPVAGFDDATAARVTLSSHTSGDAKWYADPVAVTAGDTYTFSDRYQANAPTHVTAEYRLASGGVQYRGLIALPAAGTWTEARASFTVPDNVNAIAIYHLLNQVGTLTIDNASLTKNDPVVPPPPDPGNLVLNGSFETPGSDQSLPEGWSKWSWGTNQASFRYPVAGNASARAAEVSLSAYASGDAKWGFAPIATTTAQPLVFRDMYKATVPTFVTVDYVMSDGTHVYTGIATAPASADWAMVEATFTPPAGIRSLTVYHLLNRAGTLTIDSVRLNAVSPAPPSDPANLIANADLRQTSPLDPSLPASWTKGAWGTNQASFAYPVAGATGQQNAVSVSLASHASGDAKWSFDAVPVTPGLIYRYSASYKATVPSIITARYDFANGSSIYADVQRPAAASAWTAVQVTLSPPTGAQRMTILHRIDRIGTLTTGSFSLPRPSASSSSAFSEGMVTLTFDDGYRSIYDVARPLLNRAGIKASFYLVHDYLDGSNPFYMDSTQALALNRDGHEIGSHARSHPFLTQLTPIQLQDEVAGSRQDLRALGLTPVDTFVYPYGDYDEGVVNAVRDAGYLGARSVQPGFNDKLSDPFLLVDQHIESYTTAAQVQAWIEQAKANKTWLILELHQQEGGGQYSNTPEMLQAIINNIQTSQIKTVTLSEGLVLMRQ